MACSFWVAFWYTQTEAKSFCRVSWLTTASANQNLDFNARRSHGSSEKENAMSRYACTHQRCSLFSSLSFVSQELLRLPEGVRIGLLRLGALEDLVQELLLAYSQTRAKATRGKGINKALHVGGRI